MSLLDRARASGRCPPSLLKDEGTDDASAFEAAVTRVLDAIDLSLSSDANSVEDFKSLLQMADNIDSLSGDLVESKKAILAQRRCIILAIVGATPSSNTTLASVLENGFLSTVKSWLDDILGGSVGGVDLLLHLLTHIIKLPVTKSVVKDSGMGKAIGSIEKHKICAGTPNEHGVKERVQQIKEAWNKSVKALKDKDVSASEVKPVAKRQIELDTASNSSPSAKKPRVEEKKTPSLSSLLNKVSVPRAGTAASKTAAAQESTSAAESANGSADGKAATASDAAKKAPKKSLRVKWVDHFGGDLTASKILEGDDSQVEQEADSDPSAVSWSDRKKRDRLREKELLAKAKKSKLLDDDDDMGMDMPVPKTITPTVAWHQPMKLPDRTDVAPPVVNSKEIAAQTARMTSVTPARYATEYNVPSSPAPLSDVEQALDMASQSSAVLGTIPFFVPQQTPVPAPAAPPAPAPALSYPQQSMNAPIHGGLGLPHAPPNQPQSGSAAATADTVQSLGLPLFLVGQNVQALQTLASTPSLLSTFVDGTGMYDQARLTSLVHTLSQNIAPSQPQQPPMGQVGGYQQPSSSAYGPAGHQSYSPSGGGGGGIYGPASTSAYGPGPGAGGGPRSYGGGGGGGWNSGPGGGSMRNGGYRGDQNNGEGNLHLSGYGPGTTQADIINMFAPYVQVAEIVMKGTFCFVNTSDAMGAQQAREALNGALLGGTPCRINIAQRKNRDSGPPSSYNNAGSMYGNAGASNNSPKGMRGNLGGGMPGGGMPGGGMPPMGGGMPGGGMPPMGGGMPGGGMSGGGMPKPPGQVDPNSVRDDRGNPATKNLFVAGYGPGTSETQVRELFGLHAHITGIIMKGTFSFVNTSDRNMAIHCREMLGGTMMNGGVLRINFAKETGRLGTSFDLTYGGPGGGGREGGGGGRDGGGREGGGGGGGSHSHYGRSY